MLIKFCGLTRAADVAVAESLGADYVGIIMAGGPRALPLEGARLVLGPKRHTVRRVVVFGGQPLGEIARIADELALDVVQLHGQATAESVHWLRSRVDVVIWPVVRLDGTTLPDEAVVVARSAGALLLDAKVVGQLGGTGVALDWHGLRSAVSGLRDEVPGVQLVLAGGLRTDNVQRAWDMLAPDVADVSSGVEVAPGLKDPSVMAAFLKAGRNVTLMNTNQR